MTWTPKYSTRFIETIRKGAKAIVDRDWAGVIAYYNAQADGTAAGITLVSFAKITNTRFVELFFSTRFEDFPVLIISAGNANAPESENYIDGKYTLTVEIWGVGSDPQVLRSWMERCATAVSMMFVTANARLTVGRHDYRVMRARGPNDYQDMVTFPLTTDSLVER